jgi:SWI/SNF-related matrix-associated actin-dependent regulator of chromatin subfamily A-like protein 1
MIDLPPGESLRDPQPKSIAAILKVWRDGALIGTGSAIGPLLADSMGLGKTADAVIAANTFGCRTVLVVCPKAAIGDWVRELNRWHTRLRNVIVLRAGDRWIDFENGWVVVNYALLARYPELRARQWDLVAVDEGHFAKEPNAQRTARIFGNGKDIPPIPTKKAIVISGTPLKNRIEELFTTLNFLDPRNWPDRDRFINEYYEELDINGWERIVSDTGRVHQSCPTRNLDALHRKLKATILIRTHKDNVPGLPPKVFDKILVPLCDIEKELPTGDWFERKATLLFFTGLTLREARYHAMKDPTLIDIVRDLEEEMKRITSAIQQETMRCKRQAVYEYLLSRAEKVVVICYHLDFIHDLANALRKAGRGVVVHTGGQSQSAAVTVKKFQTDPAVQFFIGQLNVSNLSLTLTASAHVVFAEIPRPAPTSIKQWTGFTASPRPRPKSSSRYSCWTGRTGHRTLACSTCCSSGRILPTKS